MRTLGLSLVLCAGIVLFAYTINRHYPLKDWLFFRYARAWLLALLLLGASSVGGYGLLEHLGGRRLPKREELSLAPAIGVLAFGFLVFVFGSLHLLGLVSFVAVPWILLSIGWSRCARDMPRIVRRLQRLDLRIEPWKLVPLSFGVLGLALIYVQILTPEAFGFDERWYHLPMAQRYALTGAITRFEEGFWLQAYPQLASYLYTWAFLTPNVSLFDRLEACVHIEFVLFLVTLAQVPLLARRLAPGVRQPLSALVMLAFPSLYLYDGNLHAGADHIAAFFAIPTALAAIRCHRDFTPRNAILLALCLGALELTKLTALSLIVPVLIVVCARGFVLALRRRLRAAQTLFTLIGTLALVTAPHWLRNLIWFRDPIYPYLHAVLPVRPWNPAAAGPFEVLQSFMSPGSWTAAGLIEAARTTLTFSFVPNDWYVFHRDVPVFGSLFTLSLPCLLFLRGSQRLWLAHACIMTSVFVWYMIQHQDRYLQVILPWMAAATAACFARVWQAGRFSRVPLIGLIALQVIWGGDVPFFRTHNQLGDSPIRAATAFLSSGFDKTPNRLRLYEPLASIGKATPKDAVVLAHDVITILGIDRNWVTDVHSSRFSYGLLRTPERVHRELSALGVTHLVWPGSALARDSLASDFAFLDYALHFTEERQVFSDYTLGRLPRAAPPPSPDDPEALVLSCGGPYASGMYRLSQLTLPVLNPGPSPTGRELPAELGTALESSRFVAIDRRCHTSADVGARFVRASRRGELELYVLANPPA